MFSIIMKSIKETNFSMLSGVNFKKEIRLVINLLFPWLFRVSLIFSFKPDLFSSENLQECRPSVYKNGKVKCLPKKV